MFRNVISVCRLLFALLLASFIAIPGRSQTPGNYPQEMRQIANDILNSESAKYLSSTGRTALELAAGRLGLPEDLRREEAQQAGARRRKAAAVPLLRPFIMGDSEVMVNDPALDIFEVTQDISVQSETAVAGFGNNILVAYNNSATYYTARSGAGYSRSTDGGMSFTDLRGLPKPTTGFNLGDPGLVADRNASFYVSFIEFDPTRPPGFGYAIGISKSTNGGATFGVPTAPPAAGVPRGSFTDKPFIAVDTSGGKYNGNVYITWTNFALAPNLPILFSRSTDGGNTFSTPIQISSATEIDQGSEPVVGPDGTIYVVWERGFDRANPMAPPAIVFVKSTNGGASFSAPVIAATVTDIGFAAGSLAGNFRVNSFPRVDVSPATGTIHVVFASNPQTAPPSGDSGDVYYTRSADGGTTWDDPVVLNDDDGLNDQFFPDIAVNGDGIVKVFWYDRRRDPLNLMIDVFETTSYDDGVSFAPNLQVNGESFPPAVGYDPLINRTYMGDYIDMKAIMTSTGPGSAFLQSWGDNRREVVTFGGVRHDQDVFFAIE